MKRILLIFGLINIFLTLSYGVRVENVPYRLVQPNGDIIEVFVSGDEFFNRIHDCDGYTIIKGDDGWYSYATYDAVNDILTPSEYIVEKTRNATLQLPMEKGLAISYEKYQERRRAFGFDEKNAEPTFLDRISNKRNGEPNIVRNIVICIGFSETYEMNYTHPQVDAMFNHNSNYNMRDYFLEMSYNEVDVISHLLPPLSETPNVLRFYKDPLPRSYFEGCLQNDYITCLRDIYQPLLKRAIEWVNENCPIPDDYDLDVDEDGRVDFVTFIVNGSPTSNTMMWPHKTWMAYENVEINGKKVWNYNFQLDGDPYYFDVGVFAHEGYHVMGASDLYHGNDLFTLFGNKPVGPFDVMADTSNEKPQSMCAYSKWKNGRWIKNMETAEWNKTYEVYPFYNFDGSDPEKQVLVKAQSSESNQYYVIQYRKKTGNKYDNQSVVPAEGLLIYRIDTRFNGNNAYDFANQNYDEIYLYRAGSAPMNIWIAQYYTNGNFTQAPFPVGATFNSTTNPRTWLSDHSDDSQSYFKNVDYDASTDSYTFFYGSGNLFFNIEQQEPVVLSYLENSTGIVEINSNVKWKVTVEPQEATEWLKLPKLSGLNEFDYQISTFSNNIGTETRTATLTFSGNGTSIPVSVSQIAVIPSFSCGSEVNFEYYNTQEEIILETNLLWDITDVDGDWFTISKLTGSGNETLIITAEDNNSFFPRTGSFKVEAYLYSQVVTVYQVATPILFAINPIEIELGDYQDANATVTISANIPWTVENYPSWISLSALQGTTGGELTVSAGNHNSSSPRTGNITIFNSEWEKTATLEITQLGKNVVLQVSTNEIILEPSADTSETIELTASHNWNITTNDTWLIVTPNFGSGNETIVIKAYENTSNDDRETTLTISSIDKTITVNVVQSGMTVNFTLSSETAVLFSENGSSQSIELVSSHIWMGQKSGNWFNFSPTSGTGNATVNITALSENLTADTRTGTVTFTNTLSQSIVLTVKQLGNSSINEINLSEIKIYPNPTKGEFKVSGLKFNDRTLSEVEVEVLDVFGRSVIGVYNISPLTERQNEMIIDVSKLPAGIYVVVIEINQQRITKKLVITE